jgi:hypothetical protein
MVTVQNSEKTSSHSITEKVAYIKMKTLVLQQVAERNNKNIQWNTPRLIREIKRSLKKDDIDMSEDVIQNRLRSHVSIKNRNITILATPEILEEKEAWEEKRRI